MGYDRQDSNAKSKSGKEPQKLKASLLAPKDYQNTLDKNQADRIARRKMLANKLKDLDKEVL
jgi:hypothetical protein